MAVAAPAMGSGPVRLVTKFAGSGSWASAAPAAGPALAADLTYPEALLFDSAGNLYFADAYGNTVNKVTPAGQLSVLAGTGNQSPSTTPAPGSATSVDLNYVTGLARDAAGNLYVASQAQNVVDKIDTSGNLTIVAGNGTRPDPGVVATPGTATQTGIRYPHAVAVDSIGNLYISDDTGAVYKVDTSGTLSIFAGTGGTTPSGTPIAGTSALLNDVEGLAVDSQDNLYVACGSDHTVVEVTPAGQLTVFAGSGSALAGGATPAAGPAAAAALNYPFALAVDSGNNLYIADPYGDNITEVTPAGQLSVVGGNGAGTSETWNSDATMSSLGGPEGVAVDPSGAVFFGDWNNSVIGRIAAVSGPSAPTSFSATAGGAAGSADLTFSAPRTPTGCR